MVMELQIKHPFALLYYSDVLIMTLDYCRHAFLL